MRVTKVIALTLAGLLGAASPLGDAHAQDRRPTVTVAVNQLARGLEPADDTGNVDVRMTYSIFDTLIRRDFASSPRGDGGKLIPGLAESWTRLNPTTLEVKLRPGVKFHNGDTLTADDVLFTFSPERLTGAKAVIAEGRIYFATLEKVEKVDDLTVRFVTNGPDAVFEARLAAYTAWIVNARAWTQHKERVERENATRPENQRRNWVEVAMDANRWNPVGTGPYRFVDRRADEQIRLAAFDDYFMGRPAAAAVTFREVPELAGRIAGLVSGEYDIIVDVSPDQVGTLERRPNLSVKAAALENTHVVVFNGLHPIVKDKRIRQALSLAIDRQALIQGLWGGRTYVPNGHQLEAFGPMYLPDRKGYAYDPAKARALLKEAGYNGQPIAYRMIPNYYLNGLEAAQVMQEMWRAVGLNVTLEMRENFDQVRTNDVAMYAWSNSYRLTDPTGAITALWGPRAGIQRTNKYFQPPEEFNDLLNKMAVEPDMTTRRTMFARVLDIFEDEMPMTMMYNPNTTYAMKANVGFTPYSLYYMDFRPDVFTIK